MAFEALLSLRIYIGSENCVCKNVYLIKFKMSQKALQKYRDSYSSDSITRSAKADSECVFSATRHIQTDFQQQMNTSLLENLVIVKTQMQGKN